MEVDGMVLGRLHSVQTGGSSTFMLVSQSAAFCSTILKYG